MFLKNPKAKRMAGNVLLLLFSLVTIFHVFVLIGLVPLDMVWGGRIQKQEELYWFEFISLALNFLFIYVVLARQEYIKTPIAPGILRMTLWVMVILFSLNTIGNLNALNRMETLIFTPITFLIAILCLALA
ncbi:hypothetical protein EHQ27_00265 [Leptospira wolffii]|nr:hypothetical protein EHQ32_11845 [Leptospira wolffii]TGK71152.1 hypothetical protein EHQ35_13500 [Leptospira wolffii]TGK77720.1 hypothetical protein EHQ27_00265 [Leptospira wolffii]TGL29570.1 hypothetical protein EHQ57_11655 [Leptospira wolffii]